MSTRSDGGAPEDPDEPPAGEADQTGEPPRRGSQLDLGGPLAYPDDGPVSRRMRRLDTWLGLGEQIALVAILAIVVLTAAAHALLDRFAEYPLEFKDHVIRAGTFAIAMLGAAFASHQARHLSMDLVSRRLSPRARLFLRVILALFTVGIVLLLVRSGFHLIDREKHEDQLLSSQRIAYLIPIGGMLIVFHTILHAIIDIDYIVRRKTPPERMRSAH